MSQNIFQIYTANPASSMVGTDLLYLGRSPYNTSDDFAIQWTDMQQSITAVGTIATGVWQGTIISPTYGGTGINNGVNTLAYQGDIQFIGAFTLQATLTGNTSIQFPTGGILLNSNLTSANFYVGNGSNIATGVAMSGDASLANTGAVTVSSIGGKAVTLGGAFTTSGAFATTFTMTGATNVTFPTSGTLATTAGASGIVNSGLINQLAWYASAGTTVSGLATAASGVLVTSAGSVPSISTTLPNGLAMGTPASLTLTNATGLPVAGLTGLGTGVATALGINVGTAGSFVVNGGALGTPSSGTLTNVSGLPIAGITGLGTGVATALAANVTGSGGIALATSPSFTTPTLGAASATSINFGASATNGIIGTTSGSTAASGVVGEIIGSQVTAGSATSISSGVTTNLTSIALTAGNWDIWGNIGINGTTVGTTVAGISNGSASLPGQELRFYDTPGAAASTVAACVPSYTVNIGSGATYYLVVNSTGTGSMIMYGGIFARRRA